MNLPTKLTMSRLFLTIVIILLLMYLTKIFKDVNIVKSFSIIIIILLIILFIINIFIKNNIIKLFKKIN